MGFHFAICGTTGLPNDPPLEAWGQCQGQPFLTPCRFGFISAFGGLRYASCICI